MRRRFLLYCGVTASLLYIAMNIFTPFLYEGYNWVTQTVSELSAIDAPTRPLWVVFGTVYTLLIAAFGWGVLKSAGLRRSLTIVGILLIINGLFGLTWTPMHQREVLAADGGTFTDSWHIVMSVITVLLMFLAIGVGAAALGKGFRIYSITTLLIFIVFGFLTFSEAPNINKNLTTPFIGLWERINIAAFMVWLLVFALILLRKKKLSLILSKKDIIKEEQAVNKQHLETKETVHKPEWLL